MVVPQVYILKPILFNLSINDHFLFVVLASLHNFSDVNTLSGFTTTVSRLVKILEAESEVVIDRFKKNKMVVNPDEFQAITLDKRKSGDTNTSNICKSAANQLNALIRIKNFMNFEEKKIVINSYFMTNFNYCPLVASSLKKIENLQKRAVRF